MEPKKTRVTIVGSSYAKPGCQFVYEGRTAACESCSIARVCHNLEPGKRYEVTAIRAASHHCPVHHEGAVTVDVTDAPVDIRIPPELARKNTTITIHLPECDEVCPAFADCHPAGVKNGQKFIITELRDADPVPCRQGPNPVMVRIVPLPEGLPRYAH